MQPSSSNGSPSDVREGSRYVSDFRRDDFAAVSASSPQDMAAPFGLTAAGTLPEADRTPAMLIHLSPLLMFVLPAFGNLLGPLGAWLIYRDRSRVLDAEGKDAINFQLSMLIYSVVGSLILILLGALGFLGGVAGIAAGSGILASLGFLGGIGMVILLMLLGTFLYIIPIIVMILAVMRVSEGRPYRYPMTLRLLR